jgi:hypothetical protein
MPVVVTAAEYLSLKMTPFCPSTGKTVEFDVLATVGE